MLQIRRFSGAVALAAMIVSHPSFASAGPPTPGVYTADPPAEIKILLNDLLWRKNPEHAVRRLSTYPEAAPYLRAALRNAPRIHDYKQDLNEALAKTDAKIYERNRKRYERWLEEGRLDLCAEILIACPEKDDAPGLADLTIPLRKMIYEEYEKACDPWPPLPPGFGPLPPKFDKTLFCSPNFSLARSLVQETGGNLTLQPTTGIDSLVLVRAERCTTEVFCRDNWLVAARSELNEQLEKGKGPYGEWFRSVLFVNSAISLPRVSDCLIVCDGNVEVNTSLQRSVVIANGNINRGKWGGGGYRCYFAATGKIDFPTTNFDSFNRFSIYNSLDTVSLAEKNKPAQSERISENQKSLPFGIRFFDVRELGIVAAVQNGGIQVMEIEKESPLAQYDVRDSDVITSINDLPATSIQVFRRELRTGVVRGDATLRIRRGNTWITRIVFLDGIPAPIAPAPRVVQSRTP